MSATTYQFTEACLSLVSTLPAVVVTILPIEGIHSMPLPIVLCD